MSVARRACGNQDGTFDIDMELLPWFSGKRIGMEKFQSAFVVPQTADELPDLLLDRIG